MLKIDHFYIKVTDLQKAIDFYEEFLQVKISHRVGDRWADFSKETKVYFGIFNATHDAETFSPGDNVTLSLKTDDIELEYERIKNLEINNISEKITITQPAYYKYFQVEDIWGNIWEIADYNY